MRHERMEAALRDSEQRYRFLYEKNPSMYFTMDTDGIVISVNPFGAEQLGYAVEELIGKPVRGLFPLTSSLLDRNQMPRTQLTNRSLV